MLFMIIMGFIMSIVCFFHAGKLKKQTFKKKSELYLISSIFFFLFASYFSVAHIKQQPFKENSDAVFAYFESEPCTTMVSPQKSPSQYEVESCGKTYKVQVSEGIVTTVELLKGS